MRCGQEKKRPDRLTTQTVLESAGASLTAELQVTCVSNRWYQIRLRNIEHRNWQPAQTVKEKKNKDNKGTKKKTFASDFILFGHTEHEIRSFAKVFLCAFIVSF